MSINMFKELKENMVSMIKKIGYLNKLLNNILNVLHLPWKPSPAPLPSGMEVGLTARPKPHCSGGTQTQSH